MYLSCYLNQLSPSNYGIYSFENELNFNHYSHLETVTAPMKFKFWD